MARPKKVLYYRAKESFVATVGHDHIHVERGTLAHPDADKPGGDELWEALTDDKSLVRFFSDDETATAAPGEKRGAEK